MSRTAKDRPWWLKDENGYWMRRCPDLNCPRCHQGKEGKALGRQERRQADKARIEEGVNDE